MVQTDSMNVSGEINVPLTDSSAVAGVVSEAQDSSSAGSFAFSLFIYATLVVG